MSELRWGTEGADVPYTIEKFSDEQGWLNARRIGASTSPVIMGLSSWSSPVEAWGELSGMIPRRSHESEAMLWGKRLEAPIADEFAKRTQTELIDHGRTTIHVSKKYPWLTCSLDREITDFSHVSSDCKGPGVLEIKAVGAFKKEDWNEDAPVNYQCQVQHQLAVTGYGYGVLCALVGGQELRWIVIPRHEQFIELLLSKCEAFWNSIQSGTSPKADGSEATARALKEMFRQDSGESVALPPESQFWSSEIEECNGIISAAEDRKREAHNKLCQAIGDATFGVMPDGTRWQWKTSERKGYVVQPSQSRTLRKLKK